MESSTGPIAQSHPLKRIVTKVVPVVMLTHNAATFGDQLGCQSHEKMGLFMVIDITIIYIISCISLHK